MKMLRFAVVVFLCWAVALPGTAQIIRPKTPLTKAGPRKSAVQAVKVLPPMRANAAAASVLGSIKQAPDRSSMVQSLMGKTGTRKALSGAVKGTSVNLSVLGTAALSGKESLNAPLAAGSILGTSLPEETFEDFDWDAGIEFTPMIPGPRFSADGKGHSLGAMDIRGMRLMPDLSLNSMSQRDVVCMSIPALADLYVELPPAEATYMIAVQMAPYNLSDIDEWLDEVPCVIKLQVLDDSGLEWLEVTSLAGGRGIVGICNIKPFGADGVERMICPGMRRVSCRISLELDEPPPAVNPSPGGGLPGLPGFPGFPGWPTPPGVPTWPPAPPRLIDDGVAPPPMPPWGLPFPFPEGPGAGTPGEPPPPQTHTWQPEIDAMYLAGITITRL